MGQRYLTFWLAVRVMVLDRARALVAAIDTGCTDYFSEEGALVSTAAADGETGRFPVSLM